MKLLTFILMLALVGCGSRESRDKQTAQQIRQWVPQWTSLQTTRQIMEQHQFACSIISYDSVAQMTNSPDKDDRELDSVWTRFHDQKGQPETVTNVTHLECKSAKCDIVFMIANDKMIGFRFSGPGL